MSVAFLCEALMLVAFSVSWFVAARHMFMAQATTGVNKAVLTMVFFGCLLGICTKVWDWRVTGELSPLVILYAWIWSMALFDLVVRFRSGEARIGGVAPAIA